MLTRLSPAARLAWALWLIAILGAVAILLAANVARAEAAPLLRDLAGMASHGTPRLRAGLAMMLIAIAIPLIFCVLVLCQPHRR